MNTLDEKFLRYELDLTDDSTWLFITPDEIMNSIGLAIQEVGEFYLQGSYMTEREGLESYLIVYLFDGELDLTFRNKKYVMSAGSLFFIDCKEHYLTISNDSIHLAFVHFNSEIAAHYFGRFYELNNSSPVLQISAPCFIDRGIFQLMEMFDGDITSDISYRGIEIIVSLMTNLMITVIPKKDGDRLNECVESTLNYLIENFHRKITLDDLAQETHTSKFHLRRLFCHAMGSSPNEYLMRLRVNKARELLRLSTYTISQISEKTGFEAPSYFIKIFRKYENMTPNEFRKKWKSL